MKKAIFKSSKHVIKQALPLEPEQLTKIVRFLAVLNPPPFVLIAALLIGYLTMLRQSNLACNSDTIANSPHVLLYKDVLVRDSSLFITVRSTKTRLGVKPITFVLREAPKSDCCPVRAWIKYIRFIKLSGSSPAFMINTIKPLTTRILSRALRLSAIATIGTDAGLTLHSLRRGATQACESAGLDISGIMAAGTWESNAVKQYTKTEVIDKAPAAILSLLG